MAVAIRKGRDDVKYSRDRAFIAPARRTVAEPRQHPLAIIPPIRHVPRQQQGPRPTSPDDMAKAPLLVIRAVWGVRHQKVVRGDGAGRDVRVEVAPFVEDGPVGDACVYASGGGAGVMENVAEALDDGSVAVKGVVAYACRRGFRKWDGSGRAIASRTLFFSLKEKNKYRRDVLIGNSRSYEMIVVISFVGICYF